MDSETNEQLERQQAELLEFFKALANTERLKVIGLLAIESLNTAQIAERLKWSLPNAMKHISYLEHFGLIKSDATTTTYSLDSEALHQMSKRVLAGSKPRMSKDDFEGEDYDRKVLSAYIAPGNKLKEIPLQYKKRLVILRYVLQAFEPGERYAEKQVNEALKRFHPDSAALRRYLVDEKMMQREAGVYWRVS